MIVIDIKNAREVADRESAKAKLLGSLVSEETIKRAVEEEVAKRLKREFSERGLDANVEVLPPSAVEEYVEESRDAADTDSDHRA